MTLWIEEQPPVLGLQEHPSYPHSVPVIFHTNDLHPTIYSYASIKLWKQTLLQRSHIFSHRHLKSKHSLLPLCMLRSTVHSTLLSFHDWKQCLVFLYLNLYNRYISFLQRCSFTYIFKSSLSCFSAQPHARHNGIPASISTATLSSTESTRWHCCWYDRSNYWQRRTLGQSLTVNTTAHIVSAGGEQSSRYLDSLNYFHMKKRCIDCGLSYKTAHALDIHEFRVHSADQKVFKGTSEQSKHFVVPLSRRILDSGGHKLAVNCMSLAQHTLISICHNSCSTDFSPSVWIQYPGTCIDKNELQNNEARKLVSSASQDCLMKILKLIVELANSFNEKLADSI